MARKKATVRTNTDAADNTSNDAVLTISVADAIQKFIDSPSDLSTPSTETPTDATSDTPSTPSTPGSPTTTTPVDGDTSTELLHSIETTTEQLSLSEELKEVEEEEFPSPPVQKPFKPEQLTASKRSSFNTENSICGSCGAKGFKVALEQSLILATNKNHYYKLTYYWMCNGPTPHRAHALIPIQLNDKFGFTSYPMLVVPNGMVAQSAVDVNL